MLIFQKLSTLYRFFAHNLSSHAAQQLALKDLTKCDKNRLLKIVPLKKNNKHDYGMEYVTVRTSYDGAIDTVY